MPLEAALLEAPPWEPAVAAAIEQVLEEPLVDLKTTSIGLVPLRGRRASGDGRMTRWRPTLDAIAERLFAGVMAPLVLGGPLLPGHAIGARAALALGEERLPVDRDLGLRVAAGRIRRARRLAPVDALPDPERRRLGARRGAA